MNILNDEELISKIRAGDENAFILLVEAYKKKILGLCYAYTSNKCDAEDLSQEVFMAFYKNRNRFRLQCSISTYLYRIAVSKCMDFKRKSGLKGIISNFFKDEKNNMEAIDEKMYVRQCINNLNKDIKIAIVLYYYLGLTQKEIGEILKVPVKTVEGRIYRGKNNLKEIISKEEVIYAE